jgi:GNAT superfamily N-acetyltransferase
MLAIRNVEIGDVSLLRTLIYEMAEHEHLPISITDEQLTGDGFGTTPQFRALLAEWDREPAGYAFFFSCYSTFSGRGLFLEDLYVRPQFRGNKIGDSLLARVVEIALRENCSGILLNVLDWNQPAIDFFQKRGFKFLNRKTACLGPEGLHAVVQH